VRLFDRESVDDIVQLVLERVWKHLRKFDPMRGSMDAWVNTIADNECRRSNHAKSSKTFDLAMGLGASQEDLSDCIETARTELGEGNLIRFIIETKDTSSDEKNRAIDLVNYCFASLDPSTILDSPVMEKDRTHFSARVRSARRRHIVTVPIDPDHTSDSEDIGGPIAENSDLIGKDPAHVPGAIPSEILDTLMELVVHARILRLMCEEGGYPWQW